MYHFILSEGIIQKLEKVYGNILIFKEKRYEKDDCKEGGEINESYIWNE